MGCRLLKGISSRVSVIKSKKRDDNIAYARFSCPVNEATFGHLDITWMPEIDIRMNAVWAPRIVVWSLYRCCIEIGEKRWEYRTNNWLIMGQDI